MKNYVHRPQADKKKIHSKNEFELCYLRHQYLRRVNKNPTQEEIALYANVITNIAKNNFFTYRSLFHTVGMETEDLISIGRVQLVSYLGLFAIENNVEKYNQFVEVFVRRHERMPEAADLLNKNKADFTEFLKQRMQDVVRVCRQKARNIRGLPTEEFYVYCSQKKPPKILTDLIENYEKLGFKKIDTATFKSIRKKARPDGNIFKFNEMWYVAVPLEYRNLGLVDFAGAGMDPYDNIHNMNPEQIYFHSQDNEEFEAKKLEFNGYSESMKKRKIKSFIRANKNNPNYSEELKAAKKLLKELGE